MSGSASAPFSPPVPPWELTVAVHGDSAQIVARGELDLETAPELDAALRRVEATARSVTVDLHELTFMDSTGVNLLTRHVEIADRDHVELSIIPPRPPVARVLDLAGVTDLLPLVDPPAPRLLRAPAASLRLSIEGGPAHVRIRLAGELDLHTVPQLRQAVDAHARSGQTMIIDLRELEFIDSMGLAALVRIRHRALARDARLQLVAAPAAVHVVFILTGLHVLFEWVGGAPQPT
jgi:anti-sigma B factor antagonist